MDVSFVLMVIGLGSAGAVLGFYIGGKIGAAQHSREHQKRMEKLRSSI